MCELDSRYSFIRKMDFEKKKKTWRAIDWSIFKETFSNTVSQKLDYLVVDILY